MRGDWVPGFAEGPPNLRSINRPKNPCCLRIFFRTWEPLFASFVTVERGRSTFNIWRSTFGVQRSTSKSGRFSRFVFFKEVVAILHSAEHYRCPDCARQTPNVES